MKNPSYLMLLVAVPALTAGCTDSPTVPGGALSNASPRLSVAGASDVEEIRVQDKCEPISFIAALGPGACVGDDNVTFDEFAEELNPDDGGHGAWRFHPDDTHIDLGESLKAINEGGQVHTFTEVVSFGAGIVLLLNAALPPGAH